MHCFFSHISPDKLYSRYEAAWGGGEGTSPICLKDWSLGLALYRDIFIYYICVFTLLTAAAQCVRFHVCLMLVKAEDGHCLSQLTGMFSAMHRQSVESLAECQTHMAMLTYFNAALCLALVLVPLQLCVSLSSSLQLFPPS